MKHIQNSIYLLITLLIGCIAYTWHHEWQEVEALEVGNKQIDEFGELPCPTYCVR